ncbi:MAG TPA: DUF3043 domain-containing protein [Kineosporiaceae bacterium]
MFGRSRTTQTTALPATPSAKVGGKGRPTPSRREAEARNRRPVVGSPRLRPGATKEEKKAARAAQREVTATERARTREAMITGDERYLPARDQGPARRFARDYVDARRNLGEYLLPAAVLVLVIGMINIPAMKLASLIGLYLVVLVIAVDSYLLRRRVARLTTEKFGDKARGVGGYAMMRSLQMRRTRLPRPQVERGRYPS